MKIDEEYLERGWIESICLKIKRLWEALIGAGVQKYPVGVIFDELPDVNGVPYPLDDEGDKENACGRVPVCDMCRSPGELFKVRHYAHGSQWDETLCIPCYTEAPSYLKRKDVLQ